MFRPENKQLYILEAIKPYIFAFTISLFFSYPRKQATRRQRIFNVQLLVPEVREPRNLEVHLITE